MHSSSQSHLKREKLEAQSKHSKTLMLQLLLLLANLVCTSNHSQAGSVHHHRTKPWPSTDQEVNRSSLLHHPYHRQMQSKCPTTPNQLAILSRLRQADENSDQVLGHSTMITPQDDLSALWLSPRSLSLSSVQKGFTMGMVCEGEEGQEIPPGSQVLVRDVWWTLCWTACRRQFSRECTHPQMPRGTITWWRRFGVLVLVGCLFT